MMRVRQVLGLYHKRPGRKAVECDGNWGAGALLIQRLEGSRSHLRPLWHFNLAKALEQVDDRSLRGR